MSSSRSDVVTQSVRCPLSVVRCPLFVVRCSLSVVRCQYPYFYFVTFAIFTATLTSRDEKGSIGVSIWNQGKFLAAMSSSRSDVVTHSVWSSSVPLFLLWSIKSKLWCFNVSSVSPVLYKYFTSVSPLFCQCFVRVSSVFGQWSVLE